MNNPKISVITVCYNAVETIEKTILSVINQTYKNVEYLIIDGKSTDGTLDILKKYSDRFAYFVSEEDKGIYDAMNKGAKAATGEWLFFINSDDTFRDKYVLSKVSDKFENYNTIYYGNIIRIPSQEIQGGKYTKYKIGMGNICHQSIFYPSKVFEKFCYNLDYKLYADWFLNILCMSDKKFKFEYLDLIICNYNTTGFSNTSIDKLFWNDYYQILIKYLGIDVALYVRIRRFLHKHKKRLSVYK